MDPLTVLQNSHEWWWNVTLYSGIGVGVFTAFTILGGFRQKSITKEIDAIKDARFAVVERNTPVHVGKLTPGSGKTPDLPIRDFSKYPGSPEYLAGLAKKLAPPDSAMLVFLGNSVMWGSNGKFPKVAIEQNGESMLSFDQDETGILVSAKFFNKDGKAICQMKNNAFETAGTNLVWGLKPNNPPNRLTVIDDELREVLDIEFINPHAIQILGDYYLRNGCPVIITPQAQLLGKDLFAGHMSGDNSGADLAIQWPTTGPNPIPDAHAHFAQMLKQREEMEEMGRALNDGRPELPPSPTPNPE